MATQLLMEKIEDSLIPVDAEGQKAIRDIPERTIVKISVSIPRNIRHHRMFFALLNLVYEAQKEPKQFPTTEKLSARLSKSAVWNPRSGKNRPIYWTYIKKPSVCSMINESFELPGGGEYSPPMPEIPAFLRRYRQEDAMIAENKFPSETPIEDFSKPKEAERLAVAAAINTEPDYTIKSQPDNEPAPPTADEIIDTIRKLAVKRDRLNETINGLKEQLIAMVQKL